MRAIGFFLFPRLTLLDFAGAYDALRRVAGVELRLVGTETSLTDEGVVRIHPEVYPDLAALDLLVVPGGLGTQPLVDDARCIDYLAGWGRERPIASVCTGALLLGRAGLLEGRRATTHFNFYDALRPYCREVVENVRVVEDEHVVTAGAVSSSLDLGLHLVGKFWGGNEKERIARAMNHQIST
jgi:transcriptional regulator GlxA family with amidase domain